MTMSITVTLEYRTVRARDAVKLGQDIFDKKVHLRVLSPRNRQLRSYDFMIFSPFIIQYKTYH